MQTYRRKLLFAGRIGPARETPTGTVLRLVATEGEAVFRLSEVRELPPTTPSAA